VRRVLIAAAACAVLAGCAAPPQPDVTFYADGKSVRAAPGILCDLATAKCDQNKDNVVSLKIRPGMPLQVSVSAYVAEKPWGLAFSYVDRDGKRVDGTSRIFLPAERRRAYTLALPDAADRLMLASVQTLGIINGDQQVSTGYWVLQTQ
jgi:hypothetical protein